MNRKINGKNILITGGTGSFGTAFTNHLLKNYKPKKIIIFSRDEYKQYEMQKIFPTKVYPALRYFIGDVRDKDRLRRAMENVNILIHAAALKQVDTAEINPMEVIKTNIFGAQNIVDLSLDLGIENVVALSTDKASSPINLYGATKLCSDKLFVTANNVKGSKKIKFSVVRYGNVLGSRGSVLPVFLKHKNKPYFPLTHKDMTRFNITLEEGVKFVIDTIKKNKGGEIFVPKIPSFKIIDLAHAIKNNPKFRIIGIRKGEKIHEELISKSECLHTVEDKNSYIILANHNTSEFKNYLKNSKLKRVKINFSFTSDKNKFFLNTNQIRSLLKRNLNIKN